MWENIFTNLISHYLTSSISGFVFLMLFLWRKWIKGILYKLVMISKVYKNQKEAEKDLLETFNKSKSLKILAIRGLGIIGLKDSLFHKALLSKEDSFELKALLLSPNSTLGLEKNLGSGEAKHSVREGINLSIQEILELKKNARCKIDMRLYEDAPLWRLFVFDNAVFVGTFLKNADGRKAPHRKITSSSRDALFFLGFNEYFDYIWNYKSVPVDAHLLKEIQKSHYTKCLDFLTESGCSQNVIRHSMIVADIADKITKNAIKDHPSLNSFLIKTGALLHDIGRSKSHKLDHGYLGGEMIRRTLFINDPIIKEKTAEIVESHVGAGFTKEEVKNINSHYNLSIPIKEYLPDTLEAQIVTYADKLVEREEKDFLEQLEEKKEQFGSDSRFVKTLEKWHQEFGKYYELGNG